MYTDKKEFTKKFLADRDYTGRFIVKSKRTGISYYVEPIDDNERSLWGDVDPATKKMTGSYGEKYKGSINSKDSLITEENGFENIVTLKPGESPLDYINRIDDIRYKDMKKENYSAPTIKVIPITPSEIVCSSSESDWRCSPYCKYWHICQDRSEGRKCYDKQWK